MKTNSYRSYRNNSYRFDIHRWKVEDMLHWENFNQHDQQQHLSKKAHQKKTIAAFYRCS